MLNYDHEHRGYVIVGTSGSGKSTFQIRVLLGTPSVRFCFDHSGEFMRKLGVRPCRTVAELIAAIPTRFVVFDPHYLFPGRPVKAFEFFAKWVWSYRERIRGRMIFSSEELQNWCGTHEGHLPPGLAQIAEEGRKYEIDFCFVAQAGNLIHNRIRAQTSELICFRITEDNGLYWPSKRGFNTDEIQSLQNHHFIAKSLETGSWHRGKLSL